MVDLNKDGKDDRTGKPVRSRRPAGNTLLDTARGIAPLALSDAVDPIRQGINGIGSIASVFGNRPDAAQGQGMGDQLFPVASVRGPGNRPKDSTRPGSNWKGGDPNRGVGAVEADTDVKSFADYLAEAQAMIGDQMSGGRGLINYDPERNTLRQNASENDARLDAMYRQLRGSIDADAGTLNTAYQGAQDATAKNVETAQAATQGASDAAQSANAGVLASLGIQQAAGNQIIEGRDAASQTAQQIADQASKGQAAGDLLASNQASAVQNNTNIGNAAGLEGNLQRAANQSKLMQLLSQIDMEEQSQNASAAASSDNSFSTALNLAAQFQGRDDDLQMSAFQAMNDQQLAAAKQATAYNPQAFTEWLNSQGLLQGLSTITDPVKKAQALNSYRQVYTGGR